MIEPEHVLTQTLMDQGYECVRLHYKECIHGAGGAMAKRLKMLEFSFLCINFQRRKAEDVSPQRIRKFIAQMCLWIRLAKEAGADVMLIGITGPHWDGTQFAFQNIPHLVLN